MRITRGNESILQEQPLVIVRAVADEYLLVLSTPGSCSDFITASFLIKSCFYLDLWAVIQQIQVWGECTGVWLCRKALPPPELHVHSSGVDGAPRPQEGAVAKDVLNSLRKQRLQGREKVSGGSKELLHVGSLLSGLCFQRFGKKIHHFRLQTNRAGVRLR